MRYRSIREAATDPLLNELWDRQDASFAWVEQGKDQWIARISYDKKTYNLIIENDGGSALISFGKVGAFWALLDRVLTGGHGMADAEGVGKGTVTAALGLFGSVIAAVEDFMTKARPRAVHFTALTHAHAKLYNTLIKRMQPTLNKLGYQTTDHERSFAFVRNDLTEAPISDIHLLGSPYGDGNSFEDGTGFGKVDRDLLSSDKGRAKMMRAFEKTPFDFEVYFMNTTDIDGDGDDNEKVDALIARKGGGIYDSGFHGIDAMPGKIRVVMLSNLSPRRGMAPGANAPKMPMTAWTLAHKIGHSFQDHVIQGNWNTPIGTLVQQLNVCLYKLAGRRAMNNSSFVDTRFNFPVSNGEVLTMKSARDGNLDNAFELFPEVVAQYLISGRVKLDWSNKLYRSETQFNPPIVKHYEKLEKLINDTIEHLLKAIEGKVVVEL